MIFDEFYYRPELKSPLWNRLMRHYQEGGDAGGDGGDADGGVEVAEWTNDFELSDEDRKTLSKYKSHEEALKGSAHSIRQFGKMVKVPDDESSDEDRENFNKRIATYQGVPEKPEDYKIDIPELPEGMVWSEELEKGMRQIARSKNIPQGAFADIAKHFIDYQIGQHNAILSQAKETYEKLVEKWGKNAPVKLGDEKNMGTCMRAAMELSKELKLDYKDEAGEAQSHLKDSLEIPGVKGCMGNNPYMLMVFDWIWENHFKEGSTHPGGASKGKTKDFFDYEDMDQEEEALTI